jgi:hypothetical protein
MIKYLWILCSILFLLTDGASAQVPCRAKTCTEAYNACMGIRCRQTGGPNCTSHCTMWHAECLRTGEWDGVVCRHTGLIRR